MSAAANAAGYLYAHDRLPMSDLDAQVDAASSHSTVQSRQVQSQPVKQVRTPRIEYRKRRFHPLPSAA
jgi:hypothetical protein